MANSSEQRRKRRELRLMQQESVWLQKALFAFGKVDESREKIADLYEREPEPLELDVAGQEITAEDLQEALEERIQERLATIKERRGGFAG